MAAPGAPMIPSPRSTYLPFLTVTLDGPRDGGNFGSATPQTTTQGVQEAIHALGPNGGCVEVAPGINLGTVTIDRPGVRLRFGSSWKGTVVENLVIDSVDGQIGQVDVVGGSFHQVNFNPRADHNITNVRFWGPQLLVNRGGGIKYNNGPGENYVQAIDFYGARFMDTNGGGQANFVGGSNGSAGHYKYWSPYYVAANAPAPSTWLGFPAPPANMGTVIAMLGGSFCCYNPSGLKLVDVPGGNGGDTFVRGIHWEHCYYEAHAKITGVTLGAVAPGLLHFYNVFDQCTYNMAPSGSWATGDVTNVRWKPRARSGRSGIVTVHGNLTGVPTYGDGNLGTSTEDYVAAVIDPHGFLRGAGPGTG